MRIGLSTSLFALEPQDDSGIGLHYRLLADELATMGHRVYVIFATAEPERARQAINRSAGGWTVDIVGTTLPKFLVRLAASNWPRQTLLQRLYDMTRLAHATARAARRHQLEIIETHTFGAPLLLYLLTRRRITVVSRVCTTAGQLRAASTMRSRALACLEFLETQATKRSDVTITHTVGHRDEICSLVGLDPSRMHLVPLGVQEPPRTSAPTTPGTRPYVLFVGRFNARKGIDVLLEAIPAVMRERPDIDFVLVGSHATSQEWRDFLVREPDRCGGRVQATGQVSRSELDRLLANCLLFVAPSRYESFGLIYVEAMSHGKAVVGCRAGGIPDVVTDGVTGLLAEPGNAADLASKIVTLLRDPDRMREMGQAARKDFEARFTARRMAEASVALYTQFV